MEKFKEWVKSHKHFVIGAAIGLVALVVGFLFYRKKSNGGTSGNSLPQYSTVPTTSLSAPANNGTGGGVSTGNGITSTPSTDTTSQNINPNDPTIAALESAITNLSTQYQTDVTRLNSALAADTSNIGVLTSQAKTNQNTINSLQTQLNNLKNAAQNVANNVRNTFTGNSGGGGSSSSKPSGGGGSNPVARTVSNAAQSVSSTINHDKSQYGTYVGSGKAADVMAGDSVFTRYANGEKINTVLDEAGKFVAEYDFPVGGAKSASKNPAPSATARFHAYDGGVAPTPTTHAQAAAPSIAPNEIKYGGARATPG